MKNLQKRLNSSTPYQHRWRGLATIAWNSGSVVGTSGPPFGTRTKKIHVARWRLAIITGASRGIGRVIAMRIEKKVSGTEKRLACINVSEMGS